MILLRQRILSPLILSLALPLSLSACLAGAGDKKGDLTDEEAEGRASIEPEVQAPSEVTEERPDAGTPVAVNDAPQSPAAEPRSDVVDDSAVPEDAAAAPQSLCTNGIPNAPGTVCCALSCGACGGSGCGALPGGAESCCTGGVLESAPSCDEGSPPCVVVTKPSDQPLPSDPVGPPATGGFEPRGACSLVIDEDFSAYSGAMQTYSEADMKGDFANTSAPYKGLDGRTKVGDSSLRAFYPKDIVLGQDTGFTWFSNLSGNAEEAIMEYQVKFEKGFDWTRGGKLPGLCGGTCPRGCTTELSGGFSMRLMWHQDGSMITYPYWPDKTGKNCGDNWYWSSGVVDDRWYTIRQHIKLNTVGEANGTVKVYLDGKLVQSESNLRLRNTASVKIDKAYWTTYVGGKSVELFAPDHDQHVFFDSFKVWVGCSE